MKESCGMPTKTKKLYHHLGLRLERESGEMEIPGEREVLLQ